MRVRATSSGPLAFLVTRHYVAGVVLQAYSRSPAGGDFGVIANNPDRACDTRSNKSTLCQPTTWSVVSSNRGVLHGVTTAPQVSGRRGSTCAGVDTQTAPPLAFRPQLLAYPADDREWPRHICYRQPLHIVGIYAELPTNRTRNG